EIESQERALLLRLQTLGDQTTATKNALAALSEASGGTAEQSAVETIDRLSGLSAQHHDYSRDTILNYVKAQWADGNPTLVRADKRLPTLARLNQVAQLGPPELPSAQQDVTRLGLNLQPCERREDPDLGSGLACLSCHYRLGNLDAVDAAGTRAQVAINAAIE